MKKGGEGKTIQRTFVFNAKPQVSQTGIKCGVLPKMSEASGLLVAGVAGVCCRFRLMNC